MSSQRALLIVAVFASLHAPSALGQVPRPAPPKEYDVQLRYRIQAARNDRLKQYFPFLNFLKSVGFERDPGPEDEPENPTYYRMTGKIAATKARDLLSSPLVKTLLLTPASYQLPEDGSTPVKVSLELSAGRPIADQRRFADQVREQLGLLGFQENTIYDHRGHTRLLGTIPAEELPSLLFDLRTQPAGWLVPLYPMADIPTPLRSAAVPIRVIEVVPEPEGVAPIKPLPPAAEVPRDQEHLLKVSEELRTLIAAPDEAKKARRVELTLLETPRLGDPWQLPLQRAAPLAALEGRMGQVVTMLATPEQAAALAAVPSVISIRIARSGEPLELPPGDARDAARKALEATGLARLHAAGHRGRGVRIAVIGADFRGYEALLGKDLPKNTRLIDLTAERSLNLQPEPYPEDQKKLGHGTECARAAAQAAPDAELVLIRVGPTAPYQLLTLMRGINGDFLGSESLDQRRDDLEAQRELILASWDKLLKERRIIFDNPGPADELDEDAIKRRQRKEAHMAEVAKLKEEETEYRKSLQRYVKLLDDIRDLRRMQVVVNTLAWTDGHPMDGSSPLSRYLDDHPFRSTVWFQPVGETNGQTWTGMFRDTDGNGVMEFAPADAMLKSERWSPELNFLAWQPFAGARELELPEKARVRVTVQWREVHDPEFLRRGEDAFREPLATIGLVLLRQRDPNGKHVPADEMEVVARAIGRPLRIANQVDAAIYEQVLEFTIETPGRYALRVEGNAPVGTRPLGAATVSGQERLGELRPRLFVDVIDAPSRKTGRPVLMDYATGEGSIALPAMAQAAVAIGAANEEFSAPGPAMALELLRKPNALTPDGLPVRGTAAAASFAGGMAASIIGAGVPPQRFGFILPQRPGILLVPESLIPRR